MERDHKPKLRAASRSQEGRKAGAAPRKRHSPAPQTPLILVEPVIPTVALTPGTIGQYICIGLSHYVYSDFFF